MSAESNRTTIDVTVIGAGLAGMAACLHLVKAGLRVQCMQGDVSNSDAVGESLDWSAPALLHALGLPMKDLVDQGIATYKHHVVLKLRDGAEQEYVPGEWLGAPPFNVNLQTIHVDRKQLNQKLRDLVIASGVTLLRDKIVQVKTTGRRVTEIVTASGQRISSPWFLDASGSAASLLPRHFHSPVKEYGPRKVAIWDHFLATQTIAGTTLHTDGAGPRYMEWVWQIPIHPGTISVGYVSTAESVMQKRREGISVQNIFQSQLDHFPGLHALAAGGSPRTTSFRCRVFTHITGPNWLVIGEAAAMIDPITANGVTAALRQAAEASDLIKRFRHRKALPWLPVALYQFRVLSLAKFFNSSVEKVLYDWPIRNRIGAFRAGDVYTIPAWSLNVIYSRLRPRGWLSTAAFGALVSALRVALHLFHASCSLGRLRETATPVRLDC